MNAHLGLRYPTGGPYSEIYRFGRDLGPLAAILGFLIISGFSIAHSYRRPRGFYARRIGRIYPSLVTAVLLFTLVCYVWGPVVSTSGTIAYAPSLFSIVATLTALNGWLTGSFLGPTWSLSAELFFYLITPLLDRSKLSVFAGLMAASALLYWINQNLGIGTLAGAIYGIAAASLFWAWGAGFLYYKNRSAVSAVAMAGLGAVLLARLNWEGGSYSLITYYVAVVAIVCGGSVHLSRFGRMALNYLGDLSYPLYLIHYPIIFLLNGAFKVNSYSVLALASVSASMLCLHFVERPARAWLASMRMPLPHPIQPL